MLRIVFTVLIVVHGLIHTFGFLKAFNLVGFEGWTRGIAKPVGVIWGTTACLFLLTAVLFGLKMDWWWISGFISFVISQALIVSYWQDAKFGTALNVVILVGVILGFGAWNFDRRVQGEIENVLAGPSVAEGKVITEDSMEKLPGSVGQWLKNEIDDHTAEVTMEYSGTSGSVKFHFNEEAELESISAMRYRGSSESDERKE